MSSLIFVHIRLIFHYFWILYFNLLLFLLLSLFYNRSYTVHPKITIVIFLLSRWRYCVHPKKICIIVPFYIDLHYCTFYRFALLYWFRFIFYFFILILLIFIIFIYIYFNLLLFLLLSLFYYRWYMVHPKIG